MTPRDISNDTPIVGIGASAGGLEALHAFVRAIPKQSGACYVIVQHLSPDQQSIMDQLLQPDCAIPVTQITDGEEAKPDHVYIVPPGVTLRLTDDHFKLDQRNKTRAVFRPIDLFFTSLAEVKGRDAYCVVLSGTGSDGTEGLKTVKAQGGYALVQDSGGARFPGMPDSAKATGLVDMVLPAGQIPGRLTEIMHHRRRLMGDEAQEALRHTVEKNLSEITALLADASGNDFSEYKPGTLVRRIERRMNLMRIGKVEQFLETLRADPSQAELLAQEFLIGVTQFFRDPAAFEALRKKVVRPLVTRDQSNIRVWVPGCSSGEEAYSIAMLFLEEIEAAGTRQNLQVFGTDIDVPALIAARAGVFSPAAVEVMGEKRRDRFFSVDAGHYRAKPTLRETCVFAPHNLVQDPPFSRLDLISCRNLMIYLSSDLQKRVIPRMHFALRDGGHLFLGPSEGISGEDDLFSVVDKTHRIFARNNNTGTRYSALTDPVPRPRPLEHSVTRDAMMSVSSAQSEKAREAVAEHEFLSRFAAPFALITASGDIVYLSTRMTDFVAPEHGVPSSNIDAYLKRELRLPVRNAMREAKETGEIVKFENILIDDAGTPMFVDISVGRTRQDDGLYLLSLNLVRHVEPGTASDAIAKRDASDQDMLEIENFNLRRQLSSALQEFEGSAQELKSSNEELLSMNEELQSSNEELETSREELQSINEELETVNAELQENNGLLTRANSDLKNLFESTDVAVLFLDRNFCVRNFTPATTQLFGIRPRDIGRPISDLSSKMDYPGLMEDARTVDESLRGLEREVQIDATGETYLLRMKPYRTVENVIDGYALALVDITNRKRYEDTLERNRQDLAKQYAELENLYDTTPVGLALIGRSFEYLRINTTLAAIDGKPIEDYDGKTIPDVIPEVAEEVLPLYEEVFRTGTPRLDVEINTTLPETGDELRHFIGDFYPVRVDGEVYAVGVCVREVTKESRMMQELAAQAERQTLLMGELQHRVKNTLATINAISKLLLKPGDSAEEYQERLMRRIRAIARTHDLLTKADWTDVTLDQIVEAELAPYARVGEMRYDRHGPGLNLTSSEAVSLGMALHELATNAAKYGALSEAEGRVRIVTEMTPNADGSTHVTLTWKEVGGPPIDTTPERKGFGSLVLEKVLTRDLNAEVSIEFLPDGLRFTARFNR
ncbi:chemotaxis protein CheB [Marivita sp. S0852]|uniref:chemotaxis protein CheB n=1 Tax=Marivita sp. S0852 TaxID=3373893 RepID=UPI0039827C0A